MSVTAFKFSLQSISIPCCCKAKNTTRAERAIARENVEAVTLKRSEQSAELR